MPCTRPSSETEVDQPLVVEHGHDCEQQRGVGARDDRQPLVGPLGRAGAAGIDHDRAPAPLADAVDLADQVGVRQQRSVGRVRVRAHDHEQVGAGDVGDRDAPRAAEELGADDVLRPLIDGARRPGDLDAGEAGDRAGVAAQRVAVDVGVAHVDGDRAHAVLGHDRGQQLFAAGERLGPRDLAPLVAVADHRHADAVGVVVQFAERGALRAEEALAPHIGAVAAHPRDPVAVGLDLQAAHRLAQRAGAEVRRHGGCRLK